MIYLDTSALAKLVVEEVESPALAQWLDEHTDDVLITSALTKVELVRAAARHSPAALLMARALLAELATVPLDALVLDAACAITPASLRSLDAIHLASAATLVAESVEGSPDPVTVVAYDSRLLAAARALGLSCASPGLKD